MREIDPIIDGLNKAHTQISAIRDELDILELRVQSGIRETHDTLAKLSSTLIHIAQDLEWLTFGDRIPGLKVKVQGEILRNLIQVKDPVGWLRAQYESDCANRGIAPDYGEEEIVT